MNLLGDSSFRALGVIQKINVHSATLQSMSTTQPSEWAEWMQEGGERWKVPAKTVGLEYKNSYLRNMTC